MKKIKIFFAVFLLKWQLKKMKNKLKILISLFPMYEDSPELKYYSNVYSSYENKIKEIERKINLYEDWNNIRDIL